MSTCVHPVCERATFSLFASGSITAGVKDLITKAVDLFKTGVNAFADKALELLKAGVTTVGEALKKVPAEATSLFASMCSVTSALSTSLKRC